ncbi:JmjC domain-containing protein [Kutzneria sp. CA-103260]|uniref:JmjC domain-containing protein n=1 Tax=Kutzneria sp. CA-103260 TaxID=2802641 RepID=UPI001BA7176E|nr:cupin domain-containing protein [Kutzneria sp. CA-103260]QUQ68828.1 Cupin superfamily protein [Kutzneria sp. CA-103260]
MRAPTLARWVGDPDEFMATCWRAKPAVFRPGGGAYSPFTLADLDEALATGLLRSPYVELTRADAVIEESDYLSARSVYHQSYPGFADERKIRALLDKGATLLLRRLDQWHTPTRELLATLSTELGRPVEAFYFVTPAGQQGVPLHRDDADVLVIQVNGSKHWHVHAGPADGNWLQGRVTGEPPEQVMETTLRAGEVMYIPRGYAHRATGESGLSAHLSLTLREVHLGDLFRALQKVTATGLDLAPRPVTDDDVLATAKALLEHARLQVHALSPEDLVQAARKARLAELPPVRTPLSVVDLAAADRAS